MKKMILITGIIVILILLILFPGKKLAREHVDYKTATTDHPLMCTSCHVSIAKSPVIKALVNRNYYSPMNMAVSPDGKWLLVTAQDADKLIVINTETRKINKKIRVGLKPYEVILDKTGKTVLISIVYV